MRRINVKLFALAVVIAASVAGAVHLIHTIQARRIGPELIRQANQAELHGRPDRTAAYLSRYLYFLPEDKEILTRYSTLLARAATAKDASKDDRFTAFLSLERALRLGLSPRDEAAIRRPAARLALDLERYQDAQIHAAALFDKLPKPGKGKLPQQRGDAELEELLGRCQEAVGKFEGDAGKFDGAVDYYRAAVKDAPTEMLTHFRLARLLRKELRDRKGADKVMDDLVAANPRSFEAYFGRSVYRKLFAAELTAAEQDGAAADADRAARLAPANPQVLFLAADFARNRREWTKARDYLDRALRADPKLGDLYLAKGEVEARAGRYAAAVACLTTGLDTLPDDDRLRWLMASLKIQQAQANDKGGMGQGAQPLLGEANKLLSVLEDSGYRPELVQYLRARYLMAKRPPEWARAAERLESARPLVGSNVELLRQVDAALVRCYERTGETDKLMAATRRMPDTGPAGRLRLAEQYEAMGSYDDALGQYRQLPLEDQTPAVHLAMARLLILRNMGLPVPQRDWAEVDRALDAAGKNSADDPQVAILRAEALKAQDRFDDARALLEKACDARPEQVVFWLALADLMARRGELESISDLLDRAERAVGDKIELRLARARLASLRGGPDAPKTLAALAGRLDQLNDDDRGRLLRGLAEAYYRIGDNSAALDLWRRWTEQMPDDRGTQSVAFDLALKADDEKAMLAAQQALAQIEQAEGTDGSLASYSKACHLIWRADKKGDKKAADEARGLLAEIGSQRKDWSRVPLAEARLDELKGDNDQALEGYLSAITLGERDPDVIRRALKLLTDRHRYPEAARILGKLKDLAFASGDLRRYAAEVSLRIQDYVRALELAEQAVSAQSKDPDDHLWLGQLLWAMGQKKRAVDALHRSIELAGNDPAPRLALIQFCAIDGQKDMVETELRAAEAKLTGPDRPLALALAYELAGRPEKALASYMEAVQANPDAPTVRAIAMFFLRSRRLADARPYLERLVKLPGTAKDQVDWAKRTLAVVLTLEGDPQKRAQAREMIDSVPGAPAAGTDEESTDLRYRAQVLAGQKDPRSRREAIGLVERIVARDKAPSDSLFLAQLYDTDGQPQKAEETLRNLLKIEKSPAYLVEYIRILLRHNNPTAASSSLAELEKREPSALRTVQLRAQVLKALGHADQASALLRDVARRDEKMAPTVAVTLEELGQYGPAEELLRARAKTPEDRLALAEFLGRRGKTAEALDLCAPLWTEAPPPLVARACVAVLSSARADNAQIDRVQTWLDQALRQAPADTILLLALADVHYLRGAYRAAEKLYRTVLENEATNLMALNNLAWMLAHQTGREQEALGLVSRAIETVGTHPSLIDTRGVVQLALIRPDLAVLDFETACAAEAGPSKYFHLARAYHALHRRNDARDALSKGQALGLTTASVDPFERADYEQLVTELR
jgi:predicted Zn-dependent protease